MEQLPDYVRLLDDRTEFNGRRRVLEVELQPTTPVQPLMLQLMARADALADFAAAMFQEQVRSGGQWRLSVQMELGDQVNLMNVPADPLMFLAAVAGGDNNFPLRQVFGHDYGLSRQFTSHAHIVNHFAKSFLDAIENLTISDRVVKLEDLVIQLRYDRIDAPPGGNMNSNSGTRKRQRDEPGQVMRAFGRLDGDAKKTVGAVPGVAKYKPIQRLCGFQAILYALTTYPDMLARWVGDTDWFTAIFNGRQPAPKLLLEGAKRFKLGCEALAAELGIEDCTSGWIVSNDGSVPTTAQLFVAKQPHYQIVIINEATRMVMSHSRGPLFDRRRGEQSTFILSYTLSHISLVLRNSVKAYFMKLSPLQHFCYDCVRMQIRGHLCRAVQQCDRCRIPIDSPEMLITHQLVERGMCKCPQCDISFYNERCFKSHRCRASHQEVCEGCHKKIFANAEHICGHHKCVHCQKMVESGHRCAIKRMAEPDPPQTAAEAGLMYFAFDLESMLIPSDGPHAGNRHVVNLVVVRRCFAAEPEEYIFRTLEEFIVWIQQRGVATTLFAHNLKGYDGRMVFDYLFERHQPPNNIMWRGSKIMQMTYDRCTFADTLLHLPASLEQLPGMFGLDETRFKKGFFPYRFNIPENQSYVGPIPSIDWFDAGMMSPKKRVLFEKWYSEQTGVYDFAKELLEYCQSDVRILTEAIEAYMSTQMQICPINPFSRVTIASYAMTMYRTYHLPENMLVALNSREHVNIMRAMHGGRTDVRRMLREWSEEEVAAGVYGKYQDVQSLYPTVQFYDPMPVGAPQFRDFDKPGVNQPSANQLHRVFGFVCCDLEPTRYLHHPIIVDVDVENGRLMADLHPKKNIVVATPELHLALANGYIVTRVYWWYEFQQSYDLFKSYFRQFLKLKIEASGRPGWTRDDPAKWEEFKEYHRTQLGIEIDDAAMCNNPAKKAGAKLLCNSLWGKFGERSDRQQWRRFLCGTEDDQVYELENKWIDGAIDILFRRHTTDGNAVGIVYKHNGQLPSSHIYEKLRRSHTNIAVAAMVTSHARCRLWHEMNKLGDRVLYHDTDSIIYEHRPGEYNIPEGRYLGEWEVEEGGLPIVKFCATGPKCYSFVLREPSGGNSRCKTKIKGITLNDDNAALINYESMKKLILEEEEFIRSYCLLFRYNRQQGSMVTSQITKLFKVTYEKGDVNQQSWKVYPFGWNRFRTTQE